MSLNLNFFQNMNRRYSVGRQILFFGGLLVIGLITLQFVAGEIGSVILIALSGLWVFLFTKYAKKG